MRADDDDRAGRIALAYDPFHDEIDAVVSRAAVEPGARHGWFPFIPSRRSTKTWRRPWHIGIIHDDDRRLAAPLIAALGVAEWHHCRRQRTLFAGRPRLLYAGTACAFARPACAMIEIRNDEISDDSRATQQWAGLLAGIFSDLEPDADRARRCFRRWSVNH